MRISTAAIAVASALCLFMVALAAYGRAAIPMNAFQVRGTVFSVFSGPIGLELAGIVALLAPGTAPDDSRTRDRTAGLGLLRGGMCGNRARLWSLSVDPICIAYDDGAFPESEHFAPLAVKKPWSMI